MDKKENIRKLFGTDGIRGIANKELTPELALKTGKAAAKFFIKIAINDDKNSGTIKVNNTENLANKLKVLIGKDSRPSGDFLESAIAAGILASGVDVYTAGIISTPALAMLTKILDMDGGIVISASHNPLEDNGIKIFKKGGEKLSDNQEKLIENYILNSNSNNNSNLDEKNINSNIINKNKNQNNNSFNDIDNYDNSNNYQSQNLINNLEISNKNINDFNYHDCEDTPTGLKVGRLKYLNNSIDIYLSHITNSFSFNLNKLKIVVDCANGAMSNIVPDVLKKYQADVISFNTDLESGLINDNCGSTHPEILKELVLNSKADIGFSYDGDGDRVIGCDSKGRIFDGDVIMAFCAINMKKENLLKNNSVVTTIMANYGFEKKMNENGITVYKTNVGDRYVLEKMIETDSILGGEQSGHIIFRNFSNIGDGLVSTLIFLEYLIKTKININEIYDIIEHFPQVLKNLKVKDKNKIIQSDILKQKIKDAQSRLQGQGKVIVRPSGTEPLVRVMVEAKTKELAIEIQDILCNCIYEID